jgi:hypothetical protein
MNELSYTMGEEVESAGFYNNEPRRDHYLYKLALADEFLAIPVVTMAKLVGPGLSYKIKIINTEGIKLMDVFVAMEKEFVAGIHQFYGSI